MGVDSVSMVSPSLWSGLGCMCNLGPQRTCVLQADMGSTKAEGLEYWTVPAAACVVCAHLSGAVDHGNRMASMVPVFNVMGAHRTRLRQSFKTAVAVLWW